MPISKRSAAIACYVRRVVPRLQKLLQGPPGLPGTVPTIRRYRAKRGTSMPSAAYFRRQADICLRLSLIASDDGVSNRLITMTRGYMATSESLDRETAADPPAMAD